MQPARAEQSRLLSGLSLRGRAIVVLGATLLSLGPGCDLGKSVELRPSQGIVAVGTHARFAVVDGCDDGGWGLGVLPVAHSALLFYPDPPTCLRTKVGRIVDVSVNDPTVFQIVDQAVDAGAALFEVEAKGEGKVTISVTVETDEGDKYTVQGSMEAQKITRVELWPECYNDSSAGAMLVPAGQDNVLQFAFFGAAGDRLEGTDYYPFDLDGLTFKPSETAYQGIDVTFPPGPATYDFTSPEDPNFHDFVKSFDLTSLTALELRAPETVMEMSHGDYVWEAAALIGEDKTCRDDYTRHVWTDNSAICALDYGAEPRTPHATLTTSGPFVVWGVAPGTCTVHAEIPGTMLSDTISVEVREGWSEIAVPETIRPSAVWASAPDDVHVVGGLNKIVDNPDGTATTVTHAVVAHYDGANSWKVAELPVAADATNTSWLHAVWGSGPADVFAVGDGGTIVHYDGTTWTEQTSGVAKSLVSVSGTGPTDVYTAGDAGTLLHYDGSAWALMESGTDALLNDVWAIAPGQAYAVGMGSTALHYDGKSWSAFDIATELDTGADKNLHSVWGTSESDLYVGSDSGLYHFDGAMWQIAYPALNAVYRDVWGRGPDDVYAVGAYQSILSFDGSAWASHDTPASATSIWGVGEHQLYAADTGLGTVMVYR